MNSGTREPDREDRRRCEIVVIGTELTSGRRLDSNSIWLRDRLRRLHLYVARVIAVGDDPDDLASALRESAARADLVVSTGGLGPTEDDRTVEAAAHAAGVPVLEDQATRERLERSAAERGRPLPSTAYRMALIPRTSRPLSNSRGSAPGFALQIGRCLLAALPGVPDEMKGIYEEVLEPDLLERFGPARSATACLRIGGREEAVVDEAAAPLCRTSGLELTTLTASGSVELHLDGAPRAIEAVVERLRDVFGEDLISEHGDSVEAVVVDLARRQGGRIAVAESCTGGRVAARLTAVPGASDVLDRGFVAYSDASKSELLGVATEILGTNGAVSAEAVRAMADGARRLARCDWSVAITGIAGPGGGSAEKPVGTVWFATAGPSGLAAIVRRLPGARQRVQDLAAGIALDLLRRAVLKGRS